MIEEETIKKENINEPLAIIGMNCRFPGIDLDIEDVNAFHEMLLKGQTPIKEVPKNRWEIDAYYDANRKKADKIISRKGGFLNNVDLFDIDFFKISAAEAKQIDPQQRLFLEVSIQALHHANLTLDSLKNSNTGVYCGISTHEYSQLNYKDNIKFNAFTPFGVANSAAVGRLCHFLNLQGPSMAVDTACSSSMSALYLAATALRTRQCNMAIVGGVHLSLCPESFIGLTKANLLSPSGQCSSFDSKADGFARSEGCGVVVVKRLSDAIKDNDTIHAVIRSIVMNHDGDGASLAAPNVNAQIALHRAALEQALITASDIDYIEAHGTGTRLGDAVEFNAIQALHQGHHPDKPLIIGALKSNLGHTMSSSGVASLIKAICALKHQTIPPNLHYSTPNPLIDPECIPACLPVKVTPFDKKKNKKRYVQVSNYGFIGTNVSTVIEEFPAVPVNAYVDSEAARCFVVSANSENSLKQMMANYVDYLQNSSANLRDICYTLINCRDHYKFRCAIIATDKIELIKKIRAGNYEWKKVVIEKKTKTLTNDAQQIAEQFLAGANVYLGVNAAQYNKVDLPLYYFDRKPYWHESRIRQQNDVSQKTDEAFEPIAIIGMSCRFPQSPNVTDFLALLENGGNGMVDIPLERWDNAKFYDEDVEAAGKLYIKQLGLIDNIKNFDANFFNISPREAKFMMPQLRVSLETSYHALEDANLSIDALRDSNTGVFMGCSTNEYPGLMYAQGLSLEELNIFMATGNALSSLPGRIGYTFDFRGPTQAIDTACSSVMTAIHNACLSLQAADCDLAIAGGICLLLTHQPSITLSRAKMLSPESRCKTFSEDADGYARSEGCGMIVLKRLSSALKDKDTILAVIKGSAVNSDGKSSGFTAPNIDAQESVIRSALARANMAPGAIDFIETHGTGTPLGDPIEVKTITKIFSDAHSQEKPLYISSVKTNIGHCEIAAGAAGVIKAVLSLHTKQLFGHINFKKLNPEIELKNTVIPLSTQNWHKEEGLRVAGVSSFGFSGSNAHVVLQEAPVTKRNGKPFLKESLLLLSAKSETALELILASYHKFLTNTQELFSDICYTTATCRTHFSVRVALKAATSQQAVQMIDKKEYTICHSKKQEVMASHGLTLEQLQTAYHEGYMIKWGDYYQSLDHAFDKVKLPLYEFVREEYWYGESERLTDERVPQDWYYQLQWQQQPIENNLRNIKNNQWQLIGNDKLAPAFIAQGLNIVLENDDYNLHQLDGVIFAATSNETSFSDVETLLEFQKKTIKKLLHLVQNSQGINLQLVVLTQNSITSLAGDKLNTCNSMLVGFCKSLAFELPQFQTILIDVDSFASNFTKQVLDEINHNQGQSYEPIVAYREGKRWSARLIKRAFIEKKRLLHGQGRYLVTAGGSELGLVTLEALLASGAREIILTTDTIELSHINVAIKKIQSCYPGRIIRVVNLELSNKAHLRNLFIDINADGLLKGIVHTNFNSVKMPLIDHQDKDIDYLFSVRAKEAWYLHELSKDCELDFFVVYSSLSSIFGSDSESGGSAVNSSFDALIGERHRLGLAGTIVNWAHADLNKNQIHFLIKIVINGQINDALIIPPTYINAILDTAPMPLPMFYKTLVSNSEKIERSENKNVSPWLRGYLELESNQQFITCKQMVERICKKILERLDAELDPDEGFYDIGFDSLMLVELAFELQEELKPYLTVNVDIGFNHPSINKLAKHIETALASHFIKKEEAQTTSTFNDDSIAVIGMSCSFPRAPDIAAFERLLEEGLNGIKDIPFERWDNTKYYDPNKEAPGKSYVNKLGLIDNIKKFDAHFFGISPREAKMMEPQQRIFLECCYLALEHANYTVESLRSSLAGVFAGVGPNEYFAQLEKSGFSNEELSMYSITGNVANLIAGRVAYCFDFKGPSISIDTACSSSLVAIHYACQSLKNREIDYALAGGVNILLMPESNITLCRAKALSPDGQCKTFDEQADGYVRSEGCGVIFLKRLSDAVRDKDNVLAVIKASAVNNDGRSAGLTVPNGERQKDVMLKALNQTNLSIDNINYIEAHGTGTPLGDPIEVHAINAVYGDQRSKTNPLYLGTVKTNIGHLEGASGVAGVIKTIISLQKKTIYKNLNFKKLNPNIKINETRIALQNMEWKPGKNLRCAGINAFGFSGTNAHILLEEFPQAIEDTMDSQENVRLLILSAKSKTSLQRLVQRYQQFLDTTQASFANICFSAAMCRGHFPYRLALIARSCKEACRLLQSKEYALSDENQFNLVVPDNAALEALAIKYLQGEKVDWETHYKAKGFQFIKVELPNYAFDHSEFWLDDKSHSTTYANLIHPLLGQMFSMPNNEYLFSNKLDVHQLSYIKQHIIFEKIVFPATAHIESGLAAAKFIFRHNAFCIEKFNIERPLSPKEGQDVQIQVKPKSNGCYKLTLFAKQNDQWQVFSAMDIHSIAPVAPQSVDIEVLKSFFGTPVNVEQVYEQFNNRSLVYGEEFKVLQAAYVIPNNVLSHLVLTKTTNDLNYYFHPVLLDGALQSLLLLSSDDYADMVFVPYAFTRLTVFQEAPRSVWAHLTQHAIENDKELCVDIKLYDTTGLLIAEIEDLKLRRVTRGHFVSYEHCLQHLYSTSWGQFNPNRVAQSAVPELWVVTRDQIKAQKILGLLRYQMVDDFKKLVDIEHKNIVFLYDQNQFNELFDCCQTLFKLHPASFILVTENAYAIHEGEKVNPYHTMASAFWKSFGNELELNKNYAIDLDENSTLGTVIDAIYQEQNQENQFAVRQSLFIPRLKKKQLPTQRVQPNVSDPNGSYLITGGTGGLATSLIEYLMSRGVKHLLITSRSACPAATQVLIQHAKEKQVVIRHYQIDASNYQQMEDLVTTVQKSAFPLKGVFHLAGVVEDSLIVNLTKEALQNVLRAKMESALILHQLTQQIPLDLFVLFSSSSSILGARGQANYVAANGFLDGLAHCRHQQGLPAIAINWGPFNALGMTEKITQGLQQHGFIPIDEENIEILDVLLQSKLPQISLCPMHWDIYFKYSPKQISLSDLIDFPALPQQYFFESLRTHTKEECVAILSQTLCEITTQVLGLTEVGQVKSTDDLFSLGLDSLMAIDIRNRIHDKLQCPNLSLSIEYFINSPRIDKIARYLVNELQHQFDQSLATLPNEIVPAEAITLCDVQYVFWALHKVGYPFNIGMKLQLKGELNKEHLFKAFDFVVKQNKAFWLNFNEKIPTQIIKSDGQLQLIYDDISLTNDANKLKHEFHRNMMREILLTQQPLIRLYLYKVNSSLHELHMLVPHIIFDDYSCEIVLAQFQQCYKALALGQRLVPIVEKETYLSYVKQKNDHYEKNLIEKIKFWKEYNKGYKRLSFGRVNHMPDAANQTEYLFHYSIKRKSVEQFIEWHKARNINISTGLIAASQIVFHKLSRQKKIPIILLHSGREGSQYNSVVGLFADYKRVNICLNKKYKFIDLLQSIEDQLLMTAPYQKCSHFIKESGLKFTRWPIGQYVNFIFNKFSLKNYFKHNKMNVELIDFYLTHLSRLTANKQIVNIKRKLNSMFNLKLALQNPSRLRTLISVTPSFFSKEHQDIKFANIEGSSDRVICLDRPIGNQTLWIYFSRNPQGEYVLTMNGPLTQECKNEVAMNFNQIISKFVENEQYTLADLIKD